jgi:iron-regulated transporter 1
MTAYLVWRGMRLETVSVWRGVSSAVGLTGTFAYSLSMKFCSVETTGMWSIVFQLFCLTLSYISLFVGDYNTSLVMLVTGVCASRVGLWVFDIAMTQLFQECIPNPIRGVVGGVQQSLNAFFEVNSFALGIIIPDPHQFYIYVAAGYGSVAVAMLLYTFGVYTRRDKLRPQSIELMHQYHASC